MFYDIQDKTRTFCYITERPFFIHKDVGKTDVPMKGGYLYGQTGYF